MKELELGIKIQDLVDFFDCKCERFLEFGKLYKGKEIKKYLDSLIVNKDLSDWNKIAVTCRRMIICDRELDLEKGKELMDGTRERFEELSKMFEGEHEESYNYQLLYEAIRYNNTCGLISFRRGDYSSASDYFEKACKLAKKSRAMNAFVPDTTSNVIRAKFDLFRYTLPQNGELEREYYRGRFESSIKEFDDAIRESPKYETDDEKLKLFYAHGMASLYHNKGDVFGAAEKGKIDVFGIGSADLKNKIKEAHEESLRWGEYVHDEYRKLQSKNMLCGCDIGEDKATFEKELLKGKWVRGQQFVLQRIIRNIDESRNTNKINDLINGTVNVDGESIEVKGGLKLSEDEEDKIVALHNYDAIKEAIYKDIRNIKNKEGNSLTLLGIANAKIEIAEKLRDDFSYLLYRRQAINLIRDDVFYKIDQLWVNEKYKECVNLSDDYSCRGLIELSRISQLGELKIDADVKEKIDELKKPIFNQIQDRLKDTKHLSVTLGIENNEDLAELLFAYEKVLEKPFKVPIPQITDKNIYETLIKKLEKIYQEQGQETAVLKFWTLEKEKKVRAILITRNGIQKHWVPDIELDVEELVSDIDSLNEELQSDRVKETPPQTQQDNYNDLFDLMGHFSGELELYKELSDIKNLFIIPDGKLFQLPLHLLGKGGQDLRKDSCINIYYCPTLNHLLTPTIDNTTTIGKEGNYLGVFCPTPDLYKENGEINPKLSKMDIVEDKNNIILKYDKATLESFLNAFESNEFTHIGFSTHGLFRDDLKDAYISPILLSDSFLTPYDVLFSLDLSGIQTVFIGACQVGSSKHTDENEAIGLVTTFLAKNAVSVIAPLYKIDYHTHNLFIETLNTSNVLNSSEPWNLTDVLSQCKSPYILSTFVQYANIGIVERRINK